MANRTSSHLDFFHLLTTKELQKLGMEATPRILELMAQNHGQILMMRGDVT
jgi:hypothetical protein